MIQIPVIVHMFQINIGNHLDNRGKLEKRAITFIRLSYQKLTFPKTCITAAQAIHFAAHDHGGVQSGLGQD